MFILAVLGVMALIVRSVLQALPETFSLLASAAFCHGYGKCQIRIHHKLPEALCLVLKSPRFSATEGCSLHLRSN